MPGKGAIQQVQAPSPDAFLFHLPLPSQMILNELSKVFYASVLFS
jgi:hypothetical protein